MKPISEWTLGECVKMCERMDDCEDCLLESICNLGVYRWNFQRFTSKELEGLKGLAKIGVKYIVRDSDGELFWSTFKPVKGIDKWLMGGDCGVGGKYGTLPANYFSLVRWEDIEPLDVEKELRLAADRKK